jgi:hypothetical protein
MSEKKNEPNKAMMPTPVNGSTWTFAQPTRHPMKDSTKNAAQELLADPLSSVTRSAKKSMFVFASLCCLISYTGVVPEEATILGFKFPGLTPQLIRWVLLLLLVHSYISFLIHLLADYLRHRILTDRYNLAVAHEVEEACSTPPNDEDEHSKSEFRGLTSYREQAVSPTVTKATNFAKVVLDFGFPVSFGFSSLIYFFYKLP